MIDPKTQYVRLDLWGSTLLIPIKMVPMLEHCVLVETEYSEGRSRVKLKADGSINFVMVPKEEIAAAIVAHRLES